jgi:hypothetical protein
MLVLCCLQESDSEGVPDEELAKRAWDNYRLRNDSHIVDHFQVGPARRLAFGKDLTCRHGLAMKAVVANNVCLVVHHTLAGWCRDCACVSHVHVLHTRPTLHAASPYTWSRCPALPAVSAASSLLFASPRTGPVQVNAGVPAVQLQQRQV